MELENSVVPSCEGETAVHELMQCGVCFDVFCDPQVICENNHHLCLSCYESLVKRRRSDGKEHATCPFCKEWCYADAQPNRLLDELVQDYLKAHPERRPQASSSSTSSQSTTRARRSPRRMKQSSRTLNRVVAERNDLVSTCSEMQQHRKSLEAECEQKQQETARMQTLYAAATKRAFQVATRSLKTEKMYREEQLLTQSLTVKKRMDDYETLCLFGLFMLAVVQNDALIIKVLVHRMLLMITMITLRLLVAQYNASATSRFELGVKSKMALCLVYVCSLLKIVLFK